MRSGLLVTGGARSGKSHYAEMRAAALEMPVTYIASAEAGDAEMERRIAAHAARRPSAWSLVEEPRDIAGVLAASEGVRIVDCLTLWLSNLMLADTDWEAEARALVDALNQQTDPVILVTNEVGSGIVPDNALARAFQDASGTVNRMVATAVAEVVLVVAGHPLRIKPGGA